MLRLGLVSVALWAFMAPPCALAQSDCGCPPVASRPVVEVSDNQGMGTGTTTWTCANTYLLTETVFVNSGDSLTIEPGTVVVTLPNQIRRWVITKPVRGFSFFFEGEFLLNYYLLI